MLGIKRQIALEDHCTSMCTISISGTTSLSFSRALSLSLCLSLLYALSVGLISSLFVVTTDPGKSLCKAYSVSQCIQCITITISLFSGEYKVGTVATSIQSIFTPIGIVFSLYSCLPLSLSLDCSYYSCYCYL